MRLNRLEFHLMNNPVRAASQRWIEAATLLRSAALPAEARVLEIGCGRGVGLEILERRFPAGFRVGFDLDPAMATLAQRRIRGASLAAATLVADAERLPFADASFDAAIEFGILHHVPGWRGALAELARVLKPRATFWFEDLTSRFSESGLVSAFLEHPRGLDIHAHTFRAALANTGFAVEQLDDVLGLGFFGHAVRTAASA
ncbi:MAG: class I SAM-dependent methyltransferase [bacterium]